MAIAKRINACCLILGACLGARAHAQVSVPNCFVTSVQGKGPIIAGTVTEIRPPSAGPLENTARSLPSVTIGIDQYIRGPHIPGESVTLAADWVDGLSKWPTMRQPLWYDAHVSNGKRLLLALFPLTALQKGDDPYEFVAPCVVEYDPYEPTVPIIERMVLLDSAESKNKVAKMERVLSDPSLQVRELATEYLTSVQVRDPSVRQYVFQHFAPIASHSGSPQQVEALEAVKSAYDPFSGGSELNYRILSFIAGRIADPNPSIRSIAIQCIYSHLFGGGSDKPDAGKIRLPNRADVLQQLKDDAAGTLHEQDAQKQAAKLLQTFAAQH